MGFMVTAWLAVQGARQAIPDMPSIDILARLGAGSNFSLVHEGMTQIEVEKLLGEGKMQYWFRGSRSNSSYVYPGVIVEYVDDRVSKCEWAYTPLFFLPWPPDKNKPIRTETTLFPWNTY
jgi:hypothetical protein